MDNKFSTEGSTWYFIKNHPTYRIIYKRCRCVGRFIKNTTQDVISVRKEVYRQRHHILRFIKKIAKDIGPVYKSFYDNRKKKSPLKELPLSRAGINSHSGVIIRAFIATTILGIILGAVLTLLVVMIIAPLGTIPFYYLMIPFSLLFLIPVIKHQMDNYLLGYAGERIVAEEINKIGQKKYWREYHSVFLDETQNGDIDHIIVCLKGVFCIETKTWRKSRKYGKQIQLKEDAIIVGDCDKDYNPIAHKTKDYNKYDKPVNQVMRNANRLSEFLKDNISFAKDEKLPTMTPIIVFPGWSVHEKNNGEKNDNNLYILNHKRIDKMMEEFSNNKNNKPMSEDLFEKICAAIEEKHRPNLDDDTKSAPH